MPETKATPTPTLPLFLTELLVLTRSCMPTCGSTARRGSASPQAPSSFHWHRGIRGRRAGLSNPVHRECGAGPGRVAGLHHGHNVFVLAGMELEAGHPTFRPTCVRSRSYPWRGIINRPISFSAWSRTLHAWAPPRANRCSMEKSRARR